MGLAAGRASGIGSRSEGRGVANPDIYDMHQVEPPNTPEEGYHLTEDLVDKAIASLPMRNSSHRTLHSRVLGTS
jgi:hypothetical protein